MDFFQAMQISATGLAAQRLRMNLLAGNVANVGTNKTAQGVPYRRKDVLISPLQASEIQKGRGPIRPASFESELERHLEGVQVTRIVEDNREPMKKYDPSHPDADKNGFVLMSNINVMEEMVNMMSATRSYEAGVTAINAAKDMIIKALTIGR